MCCRCGLVQPGRKFVAARDRTGVHGPCTGNGECGLAGSLGLTELTKRSYLALRSLTYALGLCNSSRRE
ncbi:hypothetical protein RHCRD62_10580 [Rhodococcus sp. RD6.2]|nr:hypothetical protein RHCRD62_10580 [Rhodococcus sp. RD6.2]